MERIGSDPTGVLYSTMAANIWFAKFNFKRWTQPIISTGSGQLHDSWQGTTTSIVIPTFATMRTFGTYKNSKSGGARKPIYANRESCQWDLRFDTSKIDIDDILMNVRNNLQFTTYVLIGGKEFGSHAVYVAGRPATPVEATEHVHCALIVKTPIKRWQALKIFRETKVDDEYCVPRNEKFTFLGWRLHHIKDDTKVDDTRIIFEHGTLPMDRIDEHNIKEIKRMLAKFPGPTDPRYTPFIEMATDEGIKRRKVEKMEAELPVLKRELAEFKERRTMDAEDINVMTQEEKEIFGVQAQLGGNVQRVVFKKED
uniref:Replication-associated protein n=1 Tax=Phoenicopteridae CRESS-DNA-virus sp. TaxID=2815051 RepID=A0A8A4XCK9_9VIRU|nr:MAG: replication-associated protein [Phoenicopteridae CRESS-DNA-virus sp.]